jgi:SpoVK/Ycf46/Vps4 family AAA+-type ATPase
LLDRDARLGGGVLPPLAPALAEAQVTAERLAADIARRGAESTRQCIPLRLPVLAERLGLDRLALDILLLALLVELDSGAEQLLSRLAPEGRGRLTVGTALDVLAPTFEARLAARARFGPRAPLLRYGLIRLVTDPVEGRASLLARAIELDEHIAAHLQGDEGLDPRLQPYTRLLLPRMGLDALLLPEELKQGLSRFVTGANTAGVLLYLQGAYGTGRRATAEALCQRLGVSLLSVDCARLLLAGEDTFAAAVRLASREARLHGAAILWASADSALEDGKPSARAALLEVLAEPGGPTFLSGSAPWEPVNVPGGRAFVRVELPRPSAAEQARLWARELGDEHAPEVELGVLTSIFRLTGGQIRDAAEAARQLARFRGADRVGMADITAACRHRHGRKLAHLARRLPARHGWDDLVLPPDRKAALREFCLQLEHRGRVLGEWGFERKLGTGRSLAALFSGPPGTGKTLAASVIAAELGVDLYHIDLSRVVSKYIGETEKHLAELFADAEAANAALFFDEADALFSKRSEVRDSHDRYANLETSYLLQRIDTYEGVVILASNFVKNIDEAFVRRLGFMIEFPSPGPAERLRIWQGLWPEEVPLGPDVDLPFLAERIELTGGYIRNIALAAAFLAAEDGAPVGMKHLLHAARREYQKTGKMMDAGRLVYPPGRDANKVSGP